MIILESWRQKRRNDLDREGWMDLHRASLGSEYPCAQCIDGSRTNIVEEMRGNWARPQWEGHFRLSFHPEKESPLDTAVEEVHPFRTVSQDHLEEKQQLRPLKTCVSELRKTANWMTREPILVTVINRKKLFISLLALAFSPPTPSQSHYLA